MIFAVTIVLGLAALSSVSDACRCIGLAEPRYCRTDYLALVKITGVTENEEHHRKNYQFELINDLTPTLMPKALGSLKTAKTLETGFSTAECAPELEIGQSYLIGGQFKSDDTHQPHIFTCHAFVEQWTLTGEKSTLKLDEYKKVCTDLNAKSPVPL